MASARSNRTRVRKALRVATGLAFVSSFAASVVGVGVLIAPSSASGQNSNVVPSRSNGSAKGNAGGGEDAGRYDPENITAISESMETLVKGNARYAARDWPGAVDLYKKAIQLNPRNPLASYVLGETYLAMNNLSEAEAAFKQAEEVSDSKNPLVRSHILFAVADVYERQKKWPAARTAWQAYNEHAAKLGPDGGAFPQSGAERLKVVEAIMKLDKDYEIVRQRIAAEKADAGASSSTTPSAAPAKAGKK